jgi:hypothetical protein
LQVLENTVVVVEIRSECVASTVAPSDIGWSDYEERRVNTVKGVWAEGQLTRGRRDDLSERRVVLRVSLVKLVDLNETTYRRLGEVDKVSQLLAKQTEKRG